MVAVVLFLDPDRGERCTWSSAMSDGMSQSVSCVALFGSEEVPGYKVYHRLERIMA